MTGQKTRRKLQRLPPERATVSRQERTKVLRALLREARRHKTIDDALGRDILENACALKGCLPVEEIKEVGAALSKMQGKSMQLNADDYLP